MRRQLVFLFVCLAVVLCATAAVIVVGRYYFDDQRSSRRTPPTSPETYEVEYTNYNPPANDDELADDRLEDKQPVFDTALVDRRPLGKDSAWLLNASAAVIRLDVPLIKPDIESDLVTLHPSYADAVQPFDFHPALGQSARRQGKAIRRRPVRRAGPGVLQWPRSQAPEPRAARQADCRPGRQG